MVESTKKPPTLLERRMAERHHIVEVDRRRDPYSTVEESLDIVNKAMAASCLKEIGLSQYEYACHIDDLIKCGKALSLSSAVEGMPLLRDIEVALEWAKLRFESVDDADYYLDLAANRRQELPPEMVTLD